MKYGACVLTVIPGRSNPTDKAEILTQIIFGEHFEILEEQEKWTLIRTAKDDYECWICTKQWTNIDKDEYEDLMAIHPVCADFHTTATNTITGETVNLTMGAILPNLIGNSFQLAGNSWTYGGTTSEQNTRNLVPYSFGLLNSPYLWGGRTPFGIDCSGLTKLCMRMCGIQIPRDAWQQGETGETVDFLDITKEGDLAFFDNTERKITHVGIILNEGKIIHASGQVRIDKLDHEGIYREDRGKYTHKLRIIKRFF